ncbi:MAG: hypothetical protein QOF33_3219 [Thermomicrobiales bacterium]|nr:hypothetical protein [Thermomicrobiales bacterium]
MGRAARCARRSGLGRRAPPRQLSPGENGVECMVRRPDGGDVAKEPHPIALSVLRAVPPMPPPHGSRLHGFLPSIAGRTIRPDQSEIRPPLRSRVPSIAPGGMSPGDTCSRHFTATSSWRSRMGSTPAPTPGGTATTMRGVARGSRDA